MAKIGDTVRFLNAVGGGKIVRLEGRIAYVCDPDDGFETPVDINECVVVPSAANAPEIPDTPVSEAAPEKPLREPVKETASKELTAALLFEPRDIKKLSQTSFDIYLVNDSNYRLLYAVSARPSDAADFTLLAAGEAEPNVQVFIDEVNQLDINKLAVISVQLIAFKSDRDFELRAPIAFETRMDLTRLAKLHCFTSTAYSTVPVLTVPIVTNGVTARPLRLEQLLDNYPPAPQNSNNSNHSNNSNKNSTKPKTGEPTVVDLHIHELLDSTTGLQPADMLACQLREFDNRMAEAARHPGSKIIFIHGKGEGVLRAAILDRLRRRWPKCDVQDASFREYGFGATQVTIRK